MVSAFVAEPGLRGTEACASWMTGWSRVRGGRRGSYPSPARTRAGRRPRLQGRSSRSGDAHDLGRVQDPAWRPPDERRRGEHQRHARRRRHACTPPGPAGQAHFSARAWLLAPARAAQPARPPPSRHAGIVRRIGAVRNRNSHSPRAPRARRSSGCWQSTGSAPIAFRASGWIRRSHPSMLLTDITRTGR